jgi:hypothetical protein
LIVAKSFNVVMPGLDPGIHVSPHAPLHVDGRVKPGHDVSVRADQSKEN